jgi:hypothetical protein
MTPRRATFPVWMAVTLLAVLACSDRDPSTSAGVGTDASLCEVEDLAMVVGGLEPPDHVFGVVPDARLLPDSGAIVVDRQAKQLHVFDASGRFVRALGRDGDGPGELRDPIAVEVSDGRAFVWDWRQRRITAYDLDSDGVETYAVPAQANPRHHFGRIPGGFMIGTLTGFSSTGSGQGEFWTTDLGIVTFDPSAGTVDTIHHVPDQITTWVDQAQRQTGSPFFSPRADLAASDGRLFWARGDSAILVRMEGSGLDTLRWHWPARRVADGDLEAFRLDLLARRPEASHPALNRLFLELPVRETFPVVEELVPDLDGGIWVQTYTAPRDSTRTYLRLDEGGVVCRAELPRGFTATEGGRDWLLGVSTDELQVARVERWRLR